MRSNGRKVEKRNIWYNNHWHTLTELLILIPETVEWHLVRWPGGYRVVIDSGD